MILVTIGIWLCAGCIFLGICCFLLCVASVPRYKRRIVVPGLKHALAVRQDKHAVPTILANSRLDAYCALGYLCGRERLFQMDLLRRSTAGRLAEILGKRAIERDKQQRLLRLGERAKQMFAILPEDQQAVLLAYTQGVNAAIQHQRLLPPEFLVLHYRPEAWTPEDCLLVGLSLFQELTVSGAGYDRMLTVMEKTLPAEVVAFLTPDDDCYTTPLSGGTHAPRPALPIPFASLANVRRLIKKRGPKRANQQEIQINHSQAGSNGWCVSGKKTADGRGLLANDIHLTLGLPPTWYRATLTYENQSIAGLFIPGLPLPISGSSDFVSWGFTNAIGKVLDLVEIEIHPEQPELYRSLDGWKSFDEFEEIIFVRNRPEEHLLVRQTQWGPLSSRPLCEKTVALHWTMLDSAAINMVLIDLDNARTIQEAIPIFHRFGGPPMNVMLVDRDGHIGWTLCGKIPIRAQYDGTASRSWADGQTGWRGYIPEAQMPVITDPEEGFLITANNRTLGSAYPYPIGYGYTSSYRAYRIKELLTSLPTTNEQSLLKIQLDTKCGFYDFYADLLSMILTEQRVRERPLLRQALAAIRAWDGNMELGSKGIGFLVYIRSKLLSEVLGPYIALCQEADKEFAQIWYWWDCFETPLRALLSDRAPETVPEGYRDWDAFLCETIEMAVKFLCKKYHLKQLAMLSWKQIQRTTIAHPLGNALPMISKWINIPPTALPGGVYCVRVTTPWSGAAARLVVSPSHRRAGFLHMPGGQSGHPCSLHYKDQHPFWRQGTGYALEGEGIGKSFTLQPLS